MNGQGADVAHVTLIPDGNGEFTEGMGMLVDKSRTGFWEAVMALFHAGKDSMIEKMFIEGDPFKVSDLRTMLNYINSQATKPKMFPVHEGGVSFCARARRC